MYCFRVRQRSKLQRHSRDNTKSKNGTLNTKQIIRSCIICCKNLYRICVEKFERHLTPNTLSSFMFRQALRIANFNLETYWRNLETYWRNLQNVFGQAFHTINFNLEIYWRNLEIHWRFGLEKSGDQLDKAGDGLEELTFRKSNSSPTPVQLQ